MLPPADRCSVLTVRLVAPEATRLTVSKGCIVLSPIHALREGYRALAS